MALEHTLNQLEAELQQEQQAQAAPGGAQAAPGGDRLARIAELIRIAIGLYREFRGGTGGA
jgi:hypothetical protein